MNGFYCFSSAPSNVEAKHKKIVRLYFTCTNKNAVIIVEAEPFRCD